MTGLLDHRLLFVTGKGGVGKSTVATAIGMLAARRGLRTIVAEVSSQNRVQRAFDPLTSGRTVFEEVELAPGLYGISIDPQHAMEEYLKVKAGPLGSALGHSRLFGVFAMATPGMRELLSIGKIWELAQLQRRTSGAMPYDLVVVDAPATGHGVGLLRTPRTFAEIARVGPIAATAGHIAATISDRKFTGIVAVCTAEEMPVNETIDLSRELEADDLALDLIVLNGVYPQRFDDGDAKRIAETAAAAESVAVRGALQAALSAHARAGAHGAERARLGEAIAAPLLTLPQVFCEQLGRGEVEELADALEAELEAA